MARTRQGSKPPRRRWLAWSAIALLAIATTLVCTRPRSPAATPASGPALPAGHQLLVDSLDLRLRSWLPRERQRAIAAIAKTRVELTPALMWLLARPTERRFAEGAALAAELELQSAAAPLLAVAMRGPAPVRPAAIQALDHLQPIGAEVLTAWLEEPSPGVVLAALACLGQRRDLTVPTIRALLQLGEKAEADVQAAVLAALPQALPEAVADDVLRLLLNPEVQALALLALPRLPLTPATVAALTYRLPRAEPDVQVRLLARLSRFVGERSIAGTVWELALGSDSLAVRAAALHCLEAAGAACDRLPREVVHWHPNLRYCAARIYVRARRLEGVAMLVELAADSEPEASRARAEARVLLAHLTGKPPHADIAQLRAWSGQLAAVPAANLPPMPEL